MRELFNLMFYINLIILLTISLVMFVLGFMDIAVMQTKEKFLMHPFLISILSLLCSITVVLSFSWVGRNIKNRT